MEEKFCGVWGNLREEYLRSSKPILYNFLVEEGELDSYLNGYQTLYSARAEKMAEERNVNEELYKNDSLAWILATEKIQEEVQSALKKEIQR